MEKIIKVHSDSNVSYLYLIFQNYVGIKHKDAQETLAEKFHILSVSRCRRLFLYVCSTSRTRAGSAPQKTSKTNTVHTYILQFLSHFEGTVFLKIYREIGTQS